MGVNCAFGIIPFYRRETGTEFTFEALYSGAALGFPNELSETGKFGSVENWFRAGAARDHCHAVGDECRIASIGPNDAMILPHDANPVRMKFSERTRKEARRDSDKALILGRRRPNSSTKMVFLPPRGRSHTHQTEENR